MNTTRKQFLICSLTLGFLFVSSLQEIGVYEFGGLTMTACVLIINIKVFHL
jgi:hypothetical protein